MQETVSRINKVLSEQSPNSYDVLSDLGKRLYMPEGIIFQSAQSSKHAKECNASIGIATENLGFETEGKISTENLGPMVLGSVKSFFQNLDMNEIFNYAPTAGSLKLRQYWHSKIVRQNPCLKDKSDISTPVLTAGLTHGISLASDLFINSGDEIIIADKMWENYNLIFEVRYQAKLTTYPLYTENFSGFNLEALENAIAKSTSEKLILLFNFPNNPTGYTATEFEMDCIATIVKKHADLGKKFVVICDDAYYGLFYSSEIYKGSIFSKLAGIHDNVLAVKVDGVSKEDYAWGFRVGFVTFADNHKSKEAYAVLEQKATASIRSSVSSCSRIAQSVFENAVMSEGYQAEKDEKFAVLQSRGKMVSDIVYQEKYKGYWDVYPFNSGYFMCLRIKEIPADTVRKQALFRHGLGTIAFGQDLRVAFSCIEADKFEKVFDIIAKSIDEIKNGDVEVE